MMATTMRQGPRLYVEGSVDKFAIIGLLAQHGIELDKRKGPVFLEEAGSDREVFEIMRIAAVLSPMDPVGFVVDIDTEVENRWNAVKDHLQDLELNFPSSAPAEGFCQVSPVTRAKVGVWLMPDNRMNKGAIENLIEELLPESKELYKYATECTLNAKETHQAQILDKYTRRAQLFCWLSWQKKPGQSFGTALASGYLQHDTPTVQKFVAWFKKLYNLPTT
jgi:hypothetical protein